MANDKKPPKRRIDDPASIAEAVIASGKIVRPPSDMPLNTPELVIFAELCNEFSKSEITPHKIRLVAMLSQMMHSRDQEREMLQTEGSVVTNSRGNLVTNPRARIVNTLNSSILTLRRSLGIHARDLAGGDNRRVGLRRAHQKVYETMLDDDDDGLLARPDALTDAGGGHDDS